MSVTKAFKLIYFNFRGRAEISRLLFNLAGQKFEDKRIELADWAGFKSTTPFGQMPILEITDGNEKHVISQSVAIARYLANNFNMAGKNAIEKAQCDMIIDQLIDLQNSIAKVYLENPNDETELMKQLEKTIHGPIFISLQQVQTFLTKNLSTHGFLVGSDLTFADLWLMYFYDVLRDHKQPILAKLNLLKQHDDKIRNIPKIAEHLKDNAHVRVSIKF